MCEVTDYLGLSDRFFNQLAYAGSQAAEAPFGWEGAVIEPRQGTGYTKPMAQLVDAGCDLIVAPNGITFSDATQIVAEGYPDRKFLHRTAW